MCGQDSVEKFSEPFLSTRPPLYRKALEVKKKLKGKNHSEFCRAFQAFLS